MSARRPKARKHAAKKAQKAQKAQKAAPEQAQRLAERGLDGRLHLAVVLDKTSGRDRLELVRPVFVEDWQNRLAGAAANTAYAIVRDGQTPLAAAQLGKAAMDATSTLVESLLARPAPSSIACKSGCDHCCHQSVGVTPPEALAIHAYLLQQRSAAELEQVRATVKKFADRTRGLTSSERVSPDLPCPFLENHACSIYEVRPLPCRGMNSLDAEVCDKKLHDPEVQRASIEGRLPGHVLLEPIRAFHAISAGLQLALAERFGLDMQPLDLALALDLLLSEAASAQPSLAARWFARQPAFAPARGGDASADASRVGLAGAAR